MEEEEGKNMYSEEIGEIAGDNRKDPGVTEEQEEGEETKGTDQGGQKKNINYTHRH